MVLLWVFATGPTALGQDSTVVFNEINYHPATNEAASEWIELFNQMTVDIDLSDWSLTGAVAYRFPTNTVLAGGGYLVVASDPATLAQLGRPVLGPFTGRLSNTGEKLELRNNNLRVMDRVSYESEGEWPVGADGSGVTLAKVRPNAASAVPANWAASASMGGTPGAVNFVQPPPGSPLTLNEISGGEFSPFWIELRAAEGSGGTAERFVIRINGDDDREVALERTWGAEPPQLWVVTETDLGFRPSTGDKVFLYSGDGSRLYDAAAVKRRGRARFPDGTGAWYQPVTATPGRTNEVFLNQDIVINEIMYHPPPLSEIVAEYQDTLVFGFDSEWRHFSGRTSAPAGEWHTADFDDRAWSSGKGLLYVEDSALPGPKNTPLTLGAPSYYFRRSFVAPPLVAAGNPEWELRALIDDGAVIYLNGVELMRYNLPAGAIAFDTLANPGVADASITGPFTVPAEFILPGTNVFAVRVHQASANSSDIVFGLELSSRALIRPGRPYSEAPGAWVELFHRGSNAVDLSQWEITDAVGFVFPEGTRMNPGEFLVVAQDRGYLSAQHPAARILGNYDGRLSHRGDRVTLVDALGNPADSVHYHDGFPWPEFTDGTGATLELRDPRADNSSPQAWAASDTASEVEWSTHIYRGVASATLGPTRWNEFVVGLLDAGEVLLDDLSVIEAPGTAPQQLITNGSFEGGFNNWRALGNHSGSRVIIDPEDPGNRVLYLRASGPTEHMHNHLETTLAGNRAIVNGREYEIKFRARWLAGARLLNTRLYFNRLARTTVLPIASQMGTPGKVNSRHENNTGPTFSRLRHHPPIPLASEPITVEVTAADPDGVARSTLWWTLNRTTWNQVPMSRTNESGWVAMIPGHPTGTLVQFYVETADSAGISAAFPAAGRESRALIKVNDGIRPSSRLHNFRLWLTPSDSAALYAATNVMSNGTIPGTLVYDETEVFYDVRVHLQGSERGRPSDGRVGYTIQFPADHLFRGVHDSVTIDRSGGYSGIGARHDEILLRHLINRAGGMPDMYNDLIYLIAPRTQHNGSGMLLMAKYNDAYLAGLGPELEDGTLIKMELIYYPTTTVDGNPQSPKMPQPDDVIGTDFQDFGSDKELYRWNFLLENRRAEDAYARVIELGRVFGASGNALMVQAPGVIDIQEWMRCFAAKSLSGDADTYGQGYPHNQMFYLPRQGPALALPWDMDYAWARSVTSPLISEGNIGKLIGITPFRRLFYGNLRDLLRTSYNTNYLARWAAHYGTLAGQSFSGVLNYIQQRGAYVRSQLPADAPLKFTVATNNAGLVAAGGVDLVGQAGIQFQRVSVVIEGRELAVTWNTITNWQLVVPLELGVNLLRLRTADYAGATTETAVTVVSSSAVGGGLDTDHDGLPDSWENRHGFDWRRADGELDPDGDGHSNWEEYLAGTDPGDAGDRLHLQVGANSSGEISLAFTALPGRGYQLEGSDDLAANRWVLLTELFPAAAAREIAWVERIPTNQRFFRVIASAGSN